MEDEKVGVFFSPVTEETSAAATNSRLITTYEQFVARSGTYSLFVESYVLPSATTAAAVCAAPRRESNLWGSLRFVRSEKWNA